MNSKLAFASLITIGMLISMLAFFIILWQYLVGGIGLYCSLVLIIIINILLFFISPILTDLMIRFMYKSKEMKLDDFIKYVGKPAHIIQEVMKEKRHINIKNVYVIMDNTPTAFCYGSLPSESRLCVSEGLLRMLNEDEIETVIAHELGHINNWDFAIMTLAQTIIQIFYLIYSSLIKSIYVRTSDNRKKSNTIALTILIAILSYAFYIIAQYIVLYLSRIREYYADEFSVNVTKKPRALAMALIKVAYGLGIAPPEEWARYKGIESLNFSTRASFVVPPGNNPDDYIKYLDFDFRSPWAFLVELESTHPLVGKRVKHIYEVGKEMGLIGTLPKEVTLNPISANPFYLGLYVLNLKLFIFIAYVISFLLAFISLIINPVLIPIFVSFFIFCIGIPFIAAGILSFAKYSNEKEEMLKDLLMDETASPVIGKKTQIGGQVIGRGVSGYYFSTDLYVRTKENVYMLVRTDYGIPILDIIVGILRIFKMESLMQNNVEIRGWFFRGYGYWIDSEHIGFSNGTKWENPIKIGSILRGILNILIGLGVMFFALVALPLMIFAF